METEGDAVGPPKGKKSVQRAPLIAGIRDRARENQRLAYIESAKAPVLAEMPKKKAANDIIKRNMAAMAKTTKKPGTAAPGGSNTETFNINVKNTMMDKGGLGNTGEYVIASGNVGMFSEKAKKERAPAMAANNKTMPTMSAEGPRPKRKTARDLMYEEMLEYHKRPNPKKLKELREKCANQSINFEQMLNKSKEEQMKEKARQKKENPANLETKLAKRIDNGNKLIEKLRTMDDPPPYSNSILSAARYNKVRILEAHIANYSDDQGIRAQKINETDPGTGRNALHYLCYLANTDMIQLLGVTDQLKLNVLDSRDRTCMHYAAIRGKSTLINALFMLNKQYGDVLARVEVDPNYVEEPLVTKLKEFNEDINQLNEEIERANVVDQLPKARKYSDEKIGAGFGGGDEEEKQGDAKRSGPSQINIKTSAMGNGEAEVVDGEEPGQDAEEARKQEQDGAEEEPPEATEFGQSEQAFEVKMLREMDKTDNHHVDGIAFEPFERDEDNFQRGGHPQTSMRSLINFRDHKGRTPLHIAAIWNNKAACETLLYLKANPLIDDGAGYRPIDYVDPNSAIADLLKNWMSRSTPAALHPFGDVEYSIKSGAQMKQTMLNNINAKKGGMGSSGLDLADLRQMSQEALQTTKLGEAQDNYYQAAIKARKLESAIFLKTQIGSFPLTYQNAIGNSVLHNALAA